MLKFFEDAAVGKPTSVLNKWGEEPKAGRLYDLALVTFKKHKAVQRAVGLSGAQLSEREGLGTGCRLGVRASRSPTCGCVAREPMHGLIGVCVRRPRALLSTTRAPCAPPRRYPPVLCMPKCATPTSTCCTAIHCSTGWTIGRRRGGSIVNCATQR